MDMGELGVGKEGVRVFLIEHWITSRSSYIGNGRTMGRKRRNKISYNKDKRTRRRGKWRRVSSVFHGRSWMRGRRCRSSSILHLRTRRRKIMRIISYIGQGRKKEGLEQLHWTW